MPSPEIYANNVDDALIRSASRTPDKVAVTYDGREWTFREYDDAVSRVAGYLGELGLSKGDRVAAYGQNSDAYGILYLACARAALIHVPLNYALTGGELSYLLENSGATALFVDPHLKANIEALDNLPGTVESITDGPDSILARAGSGEVPTIDVEVGPEDLVQLLYTSGTTSRPKGSMMTHRALTYHQASCVDAFDIDQNDINLQCMPLYHSAGMHCFFIPFLAASATTHLLQVPDIPKIMEKVESEQVTNLFLAPTVWVPLTNHPDFATRDLSSLRKAYYGASIMPVPVVRRLQERLPSLGLYNAFGQSEIGPLSTILKPHEHTDDRLDSCGRAVLYVQMRVVDTEMNDVKAGETGEVVYRSPQLCQGYWNNEEATAEAFEGGWFHSGDLARIDEEGYITIVDRIKDVINTGGVLVASREVEDVIYTHPAVAEVAVVGTSDEKWIEKITAFVVTKDGQSVEAGEIVEHCKGELAKYKLPKDVIFIEELPRNQSGKLLKRVLRDQAPAQ